MDTITTITKLTEAEPINYESKLNVYFVFEPGKEPIIITTRYVADKKELIRWFERAKEDDKIKIVVVWPGQYRSEAFLCDPEIALERIR